MFKFRVAIGDWSGDGHGKCEYVDMTAECENIQQVCEAYFTATAKYPDLCPEGWACEYEDGTIPDDIRNAYKDLGVEFEDDEYFTIEDMAACVAAFLNLGEPSLNVVVSESAESLHFYGFDEKGRHIGFIGYGLFE